MEIYVGNVSFASTEVDIRELFNEFGSVERISMPTDQETGRPRGFCFVVMPNDGEARAAIEALNSIELQGRSLTVNQARPREPRSNRRSW